MEAMIEPLVLFICVLICSYLYHGLGITLGYHRLLSHRAFKVARWFEYLLISGGYLCFEGSPIGWVTTHRLHHRYSDLPGDPHSPRDGLYHAFIGWITEADSPGRTADTKTICPDLHQDLIYRFLDCNRSNRQAWLCLSLCIAFRLVIFLWLGPIALVANLLASLVVFVSPLLVNSICHLPTWGYRNFDTLDRSRNVLFVALWALGEGWHNNHHAVPQSARHGFGPKEFDLSWQSLRVLQFLGIAKEPRLPGKALLQIGPDQQSLVDDEELVPTSMPAATEPTKDKETACR